MDNKVGVGQNDQIGVVRCDEELLGSFLLQQIWTDIISDVAIVQIVFGLIDDQRSFCVPEQQRKDCDAALASASTASTINTRASRLTSGVRWRARVRVSLRFSLYPQHGLKAPRRRNDQPELF